MPAEGQCNGKCSHAYGVVPSDILLWCKFRVKPAAETTFSSLLLEGQILHRYVLLLMQSGGSYLAQTGVPPACANLRPEAWASPESVRGAVPPYSKQLRIQP